MLSHLIFSSLQLIQNGLSLWSDIQLGWVVHQKDNVGAVDEPLAGVVEREQAGHLFTYLQDSGNFDDVDLERAFMKSNKYGKF
jgi:ABC-type uncharacterized transport system ATPase subunit